MTVADICNGQWDALSEIYNSTENASNLDYLAASYFTSISSNFISYMQDDFDNCINIDAVENPNEWAIKLIMTNKVF